MSFFNTNNVRRTLLAALRPLKTSVKPFSNHFYFKKQRRHIFWCLFASECIISSLFFIIITKYSEWSYFVAVPTENTHAQLTC